MQTSYFKLKSSAALTDSNFGLNTKLKKKYRKRGRGTTKQPQPHSSFFPSSHPFCFVLWCVSGGCWHDSTILLKGFFFQFLACVEGRKKKCKVNFSTSALAKDIQQLFRSTRELNTPVRRGRDGRGRAETLSNASTGLVWNICREEEAGERISWEPAPKKTTPVIRKPQNGSRKEVI